MASIKLYGDTSGFVEFTVPAVANNGSVEIASKEYVDAATASSGYRAGEVIEDHMQVCNTTSLTTIEGTVGLTAVTTTQIATTTPTDVTGSVITDYVVPSGTKKVVFSFATAMAFVDAAAAKGNFELYYKVGAGSWTHVANFGNSAWIRSGYAGSYGQSQWIWPFELGASVANSDDGILTETTPTLSFKLQISTPSNSQRIGIHENQIDGTLSMPWVGIKAIAG